MVSILRRGLTASLLALAAPFAFAQPAPIKIGLLIIDSGPFATYANLMETGAKTAVDILNAEGGALGRKFEVVVQAHSGTPQTAMAAAQRLAQQGVTMITGQTISSHSLALVPRLEQMNVMMIDTYSSSVDLLQKVCSPNYFRVSPNDAMTTKMMEEFVKASGAKTWNMISMDYASGRSFDATFTELVKSMGGSVKQSLFTPTGTTDFGGQISQLSTPTDALVVTLFMSDGQSFAKQQKQFGLFEKYKLVLGNGFATDFQLEAHGDNVLGVVNALGWTPELPGARNAQYVKEFTARAKRRPFYTDSDLMVAMEVFRAGIQKAGSTDIVAIRKALEGMNIPTIYGTNEMRAADHHLIRQHGMAQVVKGPDGKNRFEMRFIKQGSEIFPPPNPGCKVS
ncbi:MAG: ABC transporter substrate-binding protein [Pseudomonadota bacterium]